jgi:hypothetical protein
MLRAISARTRFNSRAENPSLAPSVNGLRQYLHTLLFALSMDMFRLITIEAVEEKPIWSGNALDGRHERSSFSHGLLFELAPLLVESRLSLMLD